MGTKCRHTYTLGGDVSEGRWSELPPPLPGGPAVMRLTKPPSLSAETMGGEGSEGVPPLALDGVPRAASSLFDVRHVPTPRDAPPPPSEALQLSTGAAPPLAKTKDESSFDVCHVETPRDAMSTPSAALGSAVLQSPRSTEPRQSQAAPPRTWRPPEVSTVRSAPPKMPPPKPSHVAARRCASAARLAPDDSSPFSSSRPPLLSGAAHAAPSDLAMRSFKPTDGAGASEVGPSSSHRQEAPISMEPKTLHDRGAPISISHRPGALINHHVRPMTRCNRTEKAM